jgi:uncharacterized protein (DUF1501 family)
MHLCDPHACPEYNALSRRQFIAASSAAAALITSAPAWLPRVAMARDHRGSQRDVVVSIYLRGAADALSLVPPHAEQPYYDSRPTIAVPRPDSGLPDAAIDLDGFFGFAPALAPLVPSYNDGKLLVIHAAGSTDPSRSHFEAQRFMEVGKPGDNTIATGWLGRHLYSIEPMDPTALLRAVGISTALPQTLAGGPMTLPISDLDNFGLTGAGSTSASRLDAIGDLYAGATSPIDLIAQTTIDTIALLAQIDFAGYLPAGGATYPVTSFGTALKSAAALIKAQVGVEAISVDLGGWDTHANQGTTTGALNTLMAQLAQAIGAFYTDMTTLAAPSFTLVAMSEFGRRLAENGNAGSDHGHGGVMLVLGSCVNGGRVLTQWPGMAPENLYQGIDLDVTTDYRDILAEVVQQRLGNNDLAYVFPGYTPNAQGVFSC